MAEQAEEHDATGQVEWLPESSGRGGTDPASERTRASRPRSPGDSSRSRLPAIPTPDPPGMLGRDRRGRKGWHEVTKFPRGGPSGPVRCLLCGCWRRSSKSADYAELGISRDMRSTGICGVATTRRWSARSLVNFARHIQRPPRNAKSESLGLNLRARAAAGASFARARSFVARSASR